MARWLGAFLSLVVATRGLQLHDVSEPQEEWPLRDIFLIAGQSNARGRGHAENLTDQTAPENMLAWMAQRDNFAWQRFQVGPPAYLYDGLALLQAEQPNATVIVPKTTWKPFGPELAFGRELAHRVYGAGPNQKKENFGIVKVAVMQTSMFYNWTSAPYASLQQSRSADTEAVSVKTTSDQEQGFLFTRLVAEAKEAMTSERCENRRCNIKALLWVQGERDSQTREDSVTYYQELKNLVSTLRLALDTPDLFVVVAELIRGIRGSSDSNQQIMREAQRNFTEGDMYAALVTSHGLKTDWDGVHYGTKEQLILGERMAQKYIDSFAATPAEYS